MISEERKGKKAWFNIITKEKTATEIQKAPKEAKKKLGINNQVTFEKSAKRYDINLALIIVEIGKAFVKAIVYNYGNCFKLFGMQAWT